MKARDVAIHYLKEKVGLKEADRIVAEIYNDAIQAVQAERLTDDTGTPEDDAYNQAISDAVQAIEAARS